MTTGEAGLNPFLLLQTPWKEMVYSPLLPCKFVG